MLSVNDTVFQSNSALGYGGAVYLMSPFQVEVTWSTLSSNIATIGGGAYLDVSQQVTARIVWQGTVITSNIARDEWAAGGVHIHTTSTTPAVSYVGVLGMLQLTRTTAISSCRSAHVKQFTQLGL